MNWDTILWLCLLVVFLAVESGTVMIVSLWFAGGALAAMVASLLGAEIWLQVVLFLAVSVILLLTLRPLTKKFFTPKLSKTNVDAVIGKTGLVLEQIDNIHGTGRVKLDGIDWSARSVSGGPIEENTLVKVDKVEGVRLLVTPACEEIKVK